jgi:hypothetical protein
MYIDIRYIEPLIKNCIPPQKIYKNTRRLRTVLEVELYFPGFKAFIDYINQDIIRNEDSMNILFTRINIR